MKAIYRAAFVTVQPSAIGAEGYEVSERGIGVVPHDEDEENSRTSRRGSGMMAVRIEACQMSSGPTRYREVVLTSSASSE